MEKAFNRTPPNTTFDIPAVHKMRILYAYVYTIGSKMPKRDKLGIHSYVEKEFLKSFSILINASLTIKSDKTTLLKSIRIQVEILKSLIRTEYELKIISEKQYWTIELKLQEISKMITGWIKYTETQDPLK